MMRKERKNREMAAELREKMQKINMCVQTYINLYGQMPTLQEMVEWLGISYQPLLMKVLEAQCA